MESREIEIPVPWGHVAAAVWGDLNKPLVLCFHGVMDNAGTFTRLIPLLPPQFCYVCIDLPSHGRSSYFPPHLPIHTINFILVYKLIMEYFSRDTYIIMGHSYGGQLGLVFARLYPEKVQKIIMLDTVHMLPVSTNYFKDYLVSKFDRHVHMQQKLAKNQQPTYTYEEVLIKFQNRWSNHLSKEGAEALMERSLIPTDDGKFTISLDQRMKNFINPLHDFRYIMQSLKKDDFTCPVIIILGRDSRNQQVYMKSVLKYYEKKKNVLIKHVDGDHDVHNSTPEVVAPYIIKFLTKSKL